MLKEKKIKKVIINILPKPKGPFNLHEISQDAGCKTSNKLKNIPIFNITPIESAKEGELSFLENMKYLDSANLSEATAIIVPNKIINKLNNTKAILLGSDNAYASYAKALQKFYPLNYEKKAPSNLKKIKIIDDNVFIDDFVFIENMRARRCKKINVVVWAKKRYRLLYGFVRYFF